MELVKSHSLLVLNTHVIYSNLLGDKCWIYHLFQQWQQLYSTEENILCNYTSSKAMNSLSSGYISLAILLIALRSRLLPSKAWLRCARRDIEVRLQFQSIVCCFWSFLRFVKWIPQGLRLWAILLGLQRSVSNGRQQNYLVFRTRASLRL